MAAVPVLLQGGCMTLLYLYFCMVAVPVMLHGGLYEAPVLVLLHGGLAEPVLQHGFCTCTVAWWLYEDTPVILSGCCNVLLHSALYEVTVPVLLHGCRTCTFAW
jgi:hypothetical protein